MTRRPRTVVERRATKAPGQYVAPPGGLRRGDTDVQRLVLRHGGRSMLIGPAVTGDQPWELLHDGAANISLTVHDPDGVVGAFLRDRAAVMVDGARITLWGAEWCLVSVASDPPHLTLRFEDEVAWRLRQFTRPLAATSGQTTRAGFIARLVDEASQAPFPALRSWIPEELDRQPVAKAR